MPLFPRVFAVHAARPTTRTANTFCEFLVRSLDAPCTGFNQFCTDDPTNPFVAGKGRNIIPGSQSLRVSQECFSQIGWECVDDATKDLTGTG
jgi:hypothetical protein